MPKFWKKTFSEQKKINLKYGADFCIFKNIVVWAFEFRNRLCSWIFEILISHANHFFFASKVKWKIVATFSPPSKLKQKIGIIAFNFGYYKKTRPSRPTMRLSIEFYWIPLNSIEFHWIHAFSLTGYRPTDRPTDIASYRDAYDASKNSLRLFRL